MWTVIASQISQAINKPFTIEHRKSVSGGYISQAYKIEGQGQNYFIKLNQASQLFMFQAEALALRQISTTHTVVVPEVITLGISQNQSYLVLNWLELGRDKSESWKKMGRNLAKE